jgi:hypothetical protein
MFQPTQRRISEMIKSTLHSDALPFHGMLDADMVESAIASEGVQFKDRIYTPFVTLYLFHSQVLDQDHSCRAAVMWLVLWMALHFNGVRPSMWSDLGTRYFQWGQT